MTPYEWKDVTPPSHLIMIVKTVLLTLINDFNVYVYLKLIFNVRVKYVMT